VYYYVYLIFIDIFWQNNLWCQTFNTKSCRNYEVKWELVSRVKDTLNDTEKILLERINHETNLIHY
jgi:hypothetical protein